MIHKPKETVRVRFAPSPTGFLHIGGLRTALYNYLFAKKHGGTFILRVEDTDRTRLVENGMQKIIETLHLCGLSYDEGPFIGTTDTGDKEGITGHLNEKGRFGPYVQSARLPIYKTHAEILLKGGHAYVCICTAERLDILRKEQTEKKLPTKYDGHCRELGLAITEGIPYVVRLKIPTSGKTVFDDTVYGHIEFDNTQIDDQVLIKSDGFPTYHLANVVDDHLMKITHVIRGDEWLPSTPKHVLLYKAFSWTPPVFAHLPLLLNADHSKLSKRQGDVAVEDYIKKGYLPEALLNFVALLGFNPRADKELYTREELIAEFDLTKVNKSGGVVNFEKLDWMNGNYIRTKTLDELVTLAVPYLPVEVTRDKQYLKRVIGLEQERLKKLSDLAGATAYFFVEQPEYLPSILVWKKMKKEDAAANLFALHAFLSDYTTGWDAATLESTIKAWITTQGKGIGEFLWPMRVALSGREASPPPFQIAEILGKEKTLKRLSYALELAQQL